MALKIKNTEVERLAAEGAPITGETKTEAIRHALEDRKNRLVLAKRNKVKLKSSKTKDRVNSIKEYLEREVWPNIPNNILGKKITTREREEILGIQI
jgi:antitoxin VapB